MSDSQPLANIPAAPSTEATTTTTELPVAVIIVIVVGAYLVLVVFILAIRHCLVKRGMTCNCCSVCAKEGPIQCCECCITLSEACTCTLPNVTRCLDSICPNKKVSCVDIILCQCCCAGQGGGPCGGDCGGLIQKQQQRPTL